MRKIRSSGSVGGPAGQLARLSREMYGSHGAASLPVVWRFSQQKLLHHGGCCSFGLWNFNYTWDTLTHIIAPTLGECRWWTFEAAEVVCAGGRCRGSASSVSHSSPQRLKTNASPPLSLVTVRPVRALSIMIASIAGQEVGVLSSARDRPLQDLRYLKQGNLDSSEPIFHSQQLSRR
jgi:hypothetical protein